MSPRRPAQRLEYFLELAGEGDRRPIDAVLRGFDIVISSLVLLVLSPLLALTAAAVALDSGRPVLYRGMRVGRAGQIFWMYKFRTLRPDAEDRLGPTRRRSSRAGRRPR
jgi:lipopolysaccharide/colanic/teichoic acid biosynthesis glycosyltransferase